MNYPALSTNPQSVARLFARYYAHQPLRVRAHYDELYAQGTRRWQQLHKRWAQAKREQEGPIATVAAGSG